MSSFWDAFWPAFWATIPGTFLGAGGALAVGYLILHLTERHQREDQRIQLVTAIQVLRRALVDNSNVFDSLTKSLDEGRVPFDTYLDSTTWEAVRLQIAPHLHDFPLPGDLSAYYHSLAVLGRLYDRYLDLAIGTSSALGGVSVQRDGLRQFLSGRLKTLKNDADKLVSKLEALGQFP